MNRILVADDSVTIQKVIALTFADEPFEVQSVGTGAEALELVKSWKPDIVLADVIMPQMNGYELCRAVKQLEETSSVPVLLLAGTFEAFDEDEAKSVGANDFITKPFESGELIEKVKTLIGSVPAAAPGSGAAPEVVPQTVPDAPAPPPTAPVEASEPDIWDILSDSGDEAQPQATEGAPAPGFGPIEDAGVVDVGSFDVGIGRPESPSPAQPPAAAPVETVQMPGAPEVAPIPQAQTDPVASPTADQIQDVEEGSRVENMEKDFFGFETGAVEEVSATDFLDDAVEEVTFDMEQPPAATEVDAQEVSFVVPEPAGVQGTASEDAVSPELMAPEPLPVSESPPEPVPAFAPEPVFMPEPELEPEPPLELPVDLMPDLPEAFPPEPAAEPVAQMPPGVSPAPAMDIPAAAVPEPPAAAPSQAAGDVDDAAIRKLVEERVEKIAWEVVPEMAEVIIREAIQKIKDGS
jgi:CheY-like chemotaxis protein